MTDPKAELKRALALENETERKLAVVAVIDAQMQRIGFRAVVIGGVAVEFWTRGAYSTADIDLYLPPDRLSYNSSARSASSATDVTTCSPERMSSSRRRGRAFRLKPKKSTR